MAKLHFDCLSLFLHIYELVPRRKSGNENGINTFIPTHIFLSFTHFIFGRNEKKIQISKILDTPLCLIFHCYFFNCYHFHYYLISLLPIFVIFFLHSYRFSLLLCKIQATWNQLRRILGSGGISSTSAKPTYL